MKTAALTALTVMTFTFSTSAQPAPYRTAPGTISIEEGGLVTFWEARLPVSLGESLNSGYLRDDCLYVATDCGTMFSLHAETGLLRWGAILTDPAYTIFAPAHVQTADGRGPVIIPTTTQVYVKDRYTGNDIIKFRPDFPPGSPAVGFDGMILMGSANGRMVALGWDPVRQVEPVRRWDVATGGPITAAPVLYPPKNLLIASQSGAVFSCQAADKVLMWENKVGGPVLGDPVVDVSGAYVASMDRSLYKFHPHRGNLIWRTRFPDPLEQGPAVAGQTVYQYTPSQGITALDSMTGAEKWRRPDACQFVSHGSGGDALLAPPFRLLIVDHDSGKQISTVAIPLTRMAVVNSVNDSIYLLGERGSVLCLRRDKVPYLRKQQVEMAQETLNMPPPRSGTITTVTPPRPLPPREDPFRSRRDRDPGTNP